MTQENMKAEAGRAAAKLIKNNTIVGLGTGSTAACFIQALIERIQEDGLVIKAAVSSSRASSALAQKGGIKMVDLNNVDHVDITVDGADEIDEEKRMIKGGGGALLREKILASSSREMIVIVDETKLSKRLGSKKLPIEVSYYGYKHTEAKIQKCNYEGSWRQLKDGSFFITENGNLIFDIQFSDPLSSPEEEHERLMQIPGVLDTGFFFDLAGRVIVGRSDGKIEIL